MATVKVGNIPLPMLKALLPIAAEEGSRYAMHSIAVITHPIEGGKADPALTATNGKILVQARIPSPDHDGSKAMAVIPIDVAKTCVKESRDVPRRPGHVSVEVDTKTDKLLLTTSAGTLYPTPMAEGHYPPTDAVIPSRASIQTWVPLSVPLLKKLLDAVAVCGKENGAPDNDEGAVVFLGIPADPTNGILVTPSTECGVTGVIMPANVERRG